MKLSTETKKRVFVGLSGGVDSSVSAALLKEEGHEVTGVFIKVWQPDFLTCTWREDRLDAMRVCAHLGIPFMTLDLEEVYKREVVEYMVAEYQKGRTPNPDIMCNQHVKFGSFFDWARKQGADMIATGHYAQIQGDKEKTLWSSKDVNKDQTYFLWTLKQADLPYIRFPVGGMEKHKTRVLAEKFKLPTAKKHESQGLCFVGKIDVKEFLSHFIDAKPGIVIDKLGREIGIHEGAVFYTEGQRHGFSITAKNIKGPLYVISKDMAQNILTVSSRPISRKTSDMAVVLEDTNWIGNEPAQEKIYYARIRHRGELMNATARVSSKNTADITFVENKPLISSGQSLVLYEKGDREGYRCVGGGIVR